MNRDKDKKNRETFRGYKNPAPKKFVPTELGSAVFAAVDGRPADSEYLIHDENSRDDVEDGAANSSKKRS